MRFLQKCLSVATLSGALCFLALANTGCEDLAIGRTCRTLAEATSGSAVFNDQALECPTRLCVKPAKDPAVPMDQGTAAFCTTECSNNDDCEDAERRDSKNARDKRCTKGFTCGIAFETGPLKCQKICLCKDFTGDEKPAVPAICAAD